MRKAGSQELSVGPETDSSTEPVSAARGGVESRAFVATVALGDELEELRVGIIEMSGRRQALADMPISRDEALDAIDERLAANLGTVNGFIRSEINPFLFGRRELISLSPTAEISARERALLRAVMRPQMRAAYVAYLDDFYRNHQGIDTAERVAQLAAIDAELFAAEVTEERIIRKFHAAGITLARRPNVHHLAIILAPDSELADASPEDSPYVLTRDASRLARFIARAESSASVSMGGGITEKLFQHRLEAQNDLDHLERVYADVHDDDVQFGNEKQAKLAAARAKVELRTRDLVAANEEVAVATQRENDARTLAQRIREFVGQ